MLYFLSCQVVTIRNNNIKTLKGRNVFKLMHLLNLVRSIFNIIPSAKEKIIKILINIKGHIVLVLKEKYEYEPLIEYSWPEDK